MARYRGPKWRLSRREGMDLFDTKKGVLERRPNPPGQHGPGRRIKLSDYGIQLREKQKVKRMYGVLEKQFRRFFGLAARGKGVTGHNLLELLERRLDNVLFRAGFAVSRPEGRQMVAHQGVTVNGKRVDIPSFLVKTGDVIEIAPKREGQQNRAKQNLEFTKDRNVPGWLNRTEGQLKVAVVRSPERDDVSADIQEQLIVELYSK